MSNQEIEEITKSVKNVAKTFDESVKELSKSIEDMGGWSEFIKTPVGKQFAKELKVNSKSKTPMDHKRKRKRK